MILETKKFWFKKAFIILDDVVFLDAVKDKKYSLINCISYNKIELPVRTFVKEKTTGLIDLKPTEEIILKKFKETTRHRVKKTYNIDNLKFVSSDLNTNALYKLYSEFESSQGRIPIKKNEFSNFRCFSAYFNDEPVSCITIIESFPYLRVRSIFSARLRENIDKESQKAISNASRRVMWETCIWGKENNFVSLDLASINFENPKTKSITEFKMSFGVDLIKEYNYIYKSKFYSFFEKFIFIKILLKKITNI